MEVDQNYLLAVKKHLDTFALWKISNPSHDIEKAINKILPIKSYINSPNSILSIGIGDGDEVLAIHKTFGISGSNLVGLDISETSIDLTNALLVRNNVKANLVLGNAIDIPFPDNTFDIVVLSSTLHEIYSYMPDGIRCWKEALQEATRVLNDNGILFIRDFAAPELKSVTLRFKNELSKRFYEYFKDMYRSFMDWPEDVVSKIKGENILKYIHKFPNITDNNSINTTSGNAAEILLHFRNFSNDLRNGFAYLGDKSWKEINEVYLLPKENGNVNNYYSTEIYVEEVLKAVSENINEYKLECIHRNLHYRDDYTELLLNHFEVLDDKGLDITHELTKKMELIFKKHINL